VIRTLKENGVVTRHPLQVVTWQNEEGGLVGSRAASGDTLDLERQYDGIRLADGLRKIGGHPDRLAEARIPPGSFHCSS
jgi:beta-ureidopropionase / N-carbamoyl-L-amino-acid hydrolase